MTVAIGFCQRDAEQFARLLGWLKKLSAMPGGSLAQTPSVLIVANMKRPVPRQAEKAMSEIFGSVELLDLKYCINGWPQGPNAMFQAALKHCDGKQDLFWLEPDAIPLCPDWLAQIEAAWKTRKPHQHFMGALVEYHLNHLSGVGVSSREWRKHAPKLVEAGEVAWDVWCADQVLPRAKFTNLIQHVFGKEPESIDDLRPGAVIYHQNKCGSLIGWLEDRLSYSPKPPAKKKAADALGWERLK